MRLVSRLESIEEVPMFANIIIVVALILSFGGLYVIERQIGGER